MPMNRNHLVSEYALRPFKQVHLASLHAKHSCSQVTRAYFSNLLSISVPTSKFDLACSSPIDLLILPCGYCPIPPPFGGYPLIVQCLLSPSFPQSATNTVIPIMCLWAGNWHLLWRRNRVNKEILGLCSFGFSQAVVRTPTLLHLDVRNMRIPHWPLTEIYFYFWLENNNKKDSPRDALVIEFLFMLFPKFSFIL